MKYNFDQIQMFKVYFKKMKERSKRASVCNTVAVNFSLFHSSPLDEFVIQTSKYLSKPTPTAVLSSKRPLIFFSKLSFKRSYK